MCVLGSWLQKIVKREEGFSITGYAVTGALIVVTCVVAVRSLGTGARNRTNTASDIMRQANTQPSGS
jgi:hypothetical protein